MFTLSGTILVRTALRDEKRTYRSLSTLSFPLLRNTADRRAMQAKHDKSQRVGRKYGVPQHIINVVYIS